MAQANDIIHEQLTHKDRQSTQAWKALSQFLPPRDPDSNYWWRLSGRHLAAIVEAAGYAIEKQYEVLLFHYHWAVPYMGQMPRPDGGPIKWKSLISLDGSPIEYSWKWNMRSSEPDVRYVMEPIGQFPGTELDPLNQQALREMLHRLAAVMPSVDLSWTNHFLATLYDHDNAKYVQEAAAGAYLGTSVQIAAEFLAKGITIKTYFFPRKLGQQGLMPLAEWEAAIKQLDPDNAARAVIHEYIASSPEGELLTPFSFGIDNVAPAKSRLKWYFHTPHTSFASVRDIMTLGGRINSPHLASGLADLYELIKAVTNLPSDFPEDAEVPAAPQWDSSRVASFGDLGKMLSGYLYYFDIAPGNTLPEIKFFIPVRYYSPDDLGQARGITRWMEARDRGSHCQRYQRMLEILTEHRRLEDGNGLGAEAFHVGRLGQRRPIRSQGD